MVVVQQNSSNALLLSNIQLMEENSLPGIFMTLIVHMPDLKLFFGFRFISIKLTRTILKPHSELNEHHSCMHACMSL